MNANLEQTKRRIVELETERGALQYQAVLIDGCEGVREAKIGDLNQQLHRLYRKLARLEGKQHA